MDHCGKTTPLNAQGWERGGVKQLSFLTFFRPVRGIGANDK